MKSAPPQGISYGGGEIRYGGAGKRPFSKKHDVLDCLMFVMDESQHSAGLGFFYGSFLSFFSPEIFVFENAHSWLFRCLYI